MLEPEFEDILICNQLKSGIHFWSANLEQPEFIIQKYYSILPASEKRLLDRYKVKKIRDQQVISTGILCLLLAGYLESEPQNLNFQYNKFGKPFITDSQNSMNICFNISHSNNYATYGFVKNDNIGIDIEQIREIPDVRGVVDLCFSEYEKKWFNKIPPNDKIEIFYKIWTSKEAYIKAIGRGFSFSPDRISTGLNSEGELLFENIDGDENFRRWSLRTFSFNPNFTSAVVVENHDPEITHFSIDPCVIQEKYS